MTNIRKLGRNCKGNEKWQMIWAISNQMQYLCNPFEGSFFFNCLVFSFSLAIFYWFLISAIKCNICAIHLRGVVFVFKASIAAAFERCSRCRMNYKTYFSNVKWYFYKLQNIFPFLVPLGKRYCRMKTKQNIASLKL